MQLTLSYLHWEYERFDDDCPISSASDLISLSPFIWFQLVIDAVGLFEIELSVIFSGTFL